MKVKEIRYEIKTCKKCGEEMWSVPNLNGLCCDCFAEEQSWADADHEAFEDLWDWYHDDEGDFLEEFTLDEFIKDEEECARAVFRSFIQECQMLVPIVPPDLRGEADTVIGAVLSRFLCMLADLIKTDMGAYGAAHFIKGLVDEVDFYLDSGRLMANNVKQRVEATRKGEVVQ